MELIYEGVTLDVVIKDYKINDGMGGKADSIEVKFADIKHECRKWQFKKNDCIELIEKPFTTGKMFVDGFSCSNGDYTIVALSIKKSIKTKQTKTWERIEFLDLAEDLIESHGLKLETYGVENFRYQRVDQVKRNNIEFLNYRCILEGYNLKITDGKAVIVSEKYLEEQEPILIIEPDQFIGNYNFNCTSNRVFGGCEVSSFSNGNIIGKYVIDSSLEILRIKDIPVFSIEEANRFSKNILRSYNKKELTGSFSINKNNKIAAGCTLRIESLDLFNGKYIIENMFKGFDGKTKLNVRRVLE